MTDTSAARLWESILSNSVEAPPAKPTQAPIPDHWHQPPKDPSHYRTTGEWTKVETQLVVSKTKCKCGCIFEAPNRLMNLWQRAATAGGSPTTEQKWVPLKPEEILGSAPRTLRTVEHSVDYCQHCFVEASHG